MSRIYCALLVIAALAIVSVTARQAAAQAPDSAGTYVGTLSECHSETFSLGQTYWFDVGDQGTTITNIHVTDVYVSAIGAISNLDVPVSIPISQDGSFEADFAPLGLTSGPVVASSVFEGRFVGDSVSGTYSITVNGTTCEGPFSAQRGSPPTPVPTPTPAPLALMAALSQYDGCGGGTLMITVSADRRSIIRVSASDVSSGSETFTGSADFPVGAVPIAESGSFGWVYFAGEDPGQEIAVNGTYAGSIIRGLLTISPADCDPIAFEAGPLPAPASVGSGPVTASRGEPWLVLVAGLAGVTAFASLLVATRARLVR